MKERNRIKKYKQMTPLKEIKINDKDFRILRPNNNVVSFFIGEI